MFKNFKSKLKKRMERWSKKQLKTCKVCLWIIIAFSVLALFLFSADLKVSTIEEDMQLMIFLLCYLIAIILSYPSGKMLFIISSIENKKEEIKKEKAKKEKEEEEETTAFTKVLKVLSTTEYRKVIYSPTGDDELTYCLNLLRNDGITHHAIIEGECIRIISRNNDGSKQIGHRTIRATEFCKKYEVIIE